MQRLQGVHIIEGMIQLLTDSLVLQLLSVQFICMAVSNGEKAGGGKCRSVQTMEGVQEGEKREVRSKIED